MKLQDKNKYYRGKSKTTIPYTYLLQNKTTGLKYYGVRYCNGSNPENFWIDYFTSSKLIHILIDEYGKEDFEYEIRKTFNDINSAIKHELRVLNFLKLDIRSDFLNRNKFNDATNTINKGKCIGIHNIKLNKCIRWPIEKLIPEGWTKGSLPKNTESHSKGRIWIHNTLTEESMMITKDQIIPTDWILGRPKSFYENIKEQRKDRKHIWITDGINNKQILSTDDIPEGFTKGRVISELQYKNSLEGNRKRTGNIKIHNGIITKEIRPDDIIPEGWCIGTHLKQPPKPTRNIKDYGWITNGIETRSIYVPLDIIPDGWWRGVDKTFEINYRKEQKRLRDNPDSTLPILAITYIAQFKPTGQFFYGIVNRMKKEISNFDITQTSSKIIQALIKLNGIDSFEFEIRKRIHVQRQSYSIS